jgi:adenylate kinase family enzyme
MERVVILGCAGAGKSTFARALGEKLGLPVIHLDALFWRPGWKEPPPEEFRAAVAQAVVGDKWVTDGNYVSRTFDLRLPRADAVIFIDQPRWLCICRCLWRWLTSFGRRRADLAPGCAENLDLDFYLWVWNFRRQSQPRILQVASGYPTPVTFLHGDAALHEFLSGIEG